MRFLGFIGVIKSAQAFLGEEFHSAEFSISRSEWSTQFTSNYETEGEHEPHTLYRPGVTALFFFLIVMSIRCVLPSQ